MTRTPPLKVITLGRFSVCVHGSALEFGRKTPLRPLAVLKFLAAAPAGTVAARRLADTLWPGKGAGAMRALSVNLHRLRRLLGVAEFVIHNDRHIAIDPRCVWCDASAFERMLDLAHAAADAAERSRLTARALALYRGEFLAGESGEWIEATRARLRARYVAACAAQGEAHVAAGRWDEARACFQRGVDADELAEGPCLGLMACHGALREPVAGLAVFGRFASALARQLGRSPGGGDARVGCPAHAPGFRATRICTPSVIQRVLT